MGLGSSKPTDNFLSDINRAEIEEIHKRLNRRMMSIYKDYDPYNTLDDLCLEIKLLKNIFEKYNVFQMFMDLSLTKSGLDWKDILRMFINEQNDKYHLDLPVGYCALLWGRFQRTLIFAVKEYDDDKLYLKSSIDLFIKAYEYVLSKEEMEDLMFGIDPNYRIDVTKRIICKNWFNIWYETEKQKNFDSARDWRKFNLKNFIHERCIDEGIKGDPGVLRRVESEISYKSVIYTEYGMVNGAWSHWQSRATMSIVPREVPEWLKEEQPWEEEYDYDTSYQSHVLTLYIRDEEIFNITVEKNCLEIKNSYSFITKSNPQIVLEEWERCLEQRPEDDLKEITVENRRPKIIEMCVNEYSNIKSESRIIFVNTPLKSENCLNKGFHIVNDYLYKKIELINFDEEFNHLTNDIRGEMDKISESELVLSDGIYNAHLHTVTNIKSVKWEITRELGFDIIKSIKVLFYVETEDNKCYSIYCIFKYNDFKKCWEATSICNNSEEQVRILDLYVKGQCTLQQKV